MTGLFQIIFECLSFQVCLAMLPSFLQFMLSLKSFELIRSRARPRPRLSWWWSSSLVCGHVSVLGIELSDGGGGGGDLGLSGDTLCQASGSRGGRGPY